MNEKLFGTERKEAPHPGDALVLSALYAPIVGAPAILVYILLDEWHRSHVKVRSLDRVQLLCDITGLSFSKLEHAFKVLEAVGLLRRYERVDEQAFILQILCPLSVRQFQANSFLMRAARDKIGELAMERVVFMQGEAPLDKTDYREVTTRFQDLFDLAPPAAQPAISSTLEVPLNAYASKEAAAAHLAPAQYLKFVTSERATPTQIEALNRVQQLGLASASINAITEYVVTKNSAFVTAHFETIARDLVRQGVTSVEAIKAELSRASKASHTDALAPTGAAPTTPRVSRADNLDEWEQIFNALGGEL